LAKADSYMATKEEGLERIQELVTAYRSEEGLEAWDFSLKDKQNHKALVADLTPQGSIIARKMRRRKTHIEADEHKKSST